MDGRRRLLDHVMERPRILMISGSLRRRSTNTAMLLTAQAVASPDVATVLYEGVAGLPHFNPDEDRPPLASPVADLRERIRSADAVLFSIPEYAGALPGSFKNVLDWAVGDDQPGSMNGKPVAYINVSPRGAALAHASLRSVLGYIGADIVEAACVDIPLTQESLGQDGLIASEGIWGYVAAALGALIAQVPGPGRPHVGSTAPDL
jgi:chromate reductase, NAD(P)H dehydrogenase (quinone)